MRIELKRPSVLSECASFYCILNYILKLYFNYVFLFLFWRYSDSVPIIVQKHPKSNLPELEKKKFIVPKERKLSEFYYLIRKKIRLNDTQALFLIIKDFQPNLTSTVSQIYEVNSI